jgi:hypothetical protein
VAVAHLPRDYCLAPGRPVDAPVDGSEGRYGRLFPGLGPIVSSDAALLALGAAGGACDPAGDDCLDGSEAAGWPVFGQFVAHDITADRSPLVEQADPNSIRSFRSPRANLECLYGAGPVGAPYLYDRDDPAMLLVGVNDAGRAADVPRNAQGIALVGDPRNDVHLLVSQLHTAFLRAHNLLAGRLREDGAAPDELFEEARRATAWHYQWILLHDFLDRLVGPERAAAVRDDGPQLYEPEGEPYIPFEFADAAYRYGHAQIRPTYQVNAQSDPVPLFPDLLGFQPVPGRRAVDWSYFFDVGGQPARQRSKRIDGWLARSLIELPVAITGTVDEDAYHSLAARDLQRGHAIGLPSGEAVARHLGHEPLTSDEVGLRAAGWDQETPLWYYVLKEGEVREDGDRLGPVGGTIVAEVLVGIVDRDPESYRALQPDWRPTLPAAGDQFTMGDLLAASYSEGAAPTA